MSQRVSRVLGTDHVGPALDVVAQRPGGAESFANERVDGGSRGRLEDHFILLRLHACKQGSLGLGFFLGRLH